MPFGGMNAMEKEFIHPYMPNSVPKIKAEMLKEVGVEKIGGYLQKLFLFASTSLQSTSLPERCFCRGLGRGLC